jgi:outer membrane protein
MTQKVLEQINAEVKIYGKEHGYDVRMAATHAGNLVYAEETMDLTDKILERLYRPFGKQVKNS